MKLLLKGLLYFFKSKEVNSWPVFRQRQASQA